MIETRQTGAPPARTRRPPAASYQDLVEDREETKKLIGRLIADSAERTDRVLVPLTAQTDALRALEGQLSRLVVALAERVDGHSPAEVGEGRSGSADTTTPAAVEGAGQEQPAHQEPEATVPSDAPPADVAVEADDATTGAAAVIDGNPDAGQGPAAAATTSAEPRRTASDQAEAGDPQPFALTREAAGRQTEPTENEAPPPAGRPDAAEAVRAAPSHSPAGDGPEAGEGVRADRRQADETGTGEGPATATLADMLAVLAALRDDLGTLSKLIQFIHRKPPPGAGGASDRESAVRSLRQHHELMEHIDGFIVALVEQLGRAVPSTGENRPPPAELDEIRTVASDLSKQLRAERSGFMRFSWIAAAGAVIVLPAMVALGVFLQREYDLMPVPDPSFGWKERIWEEMGAEIAGCLNLQDGGAGACVVTVTPPTE